MFSEDNESQLFKLLKGLLYACVIGAVYYAGGSGWTLLFTRDEEKRTKIGNYSIYLLFFEIILEILVFFVGFFRGGERGGESKVDTHLMFAIFKFAVLHFVIATFGTVFYLIWWLLTSIFPRLKNNKVQKSNDAVSESLSELQEYSSDTTRRLLDIQNRVNNSAMQFVTRRQMFMDEQELELKSKMIDSITNLISLYRESLQLEEYDHIRFEYFSVHDLNNVLEGLKFRIAVHIKNLENQ
jgi:hypothetical protein